MTWLLFILSVSASSASQYWQKRYAVYFDSHSQQSLQSKVFNYRLILAIFFLAFSAICWLGVLKYWSVAVAYPMLSINFIVMLLVSRYAFGETLTPHHWIGGFMVVSGVAILGMSL